MSQLSPISRKEHFLSRAAGGPGRELEPVTREEHFLAEIAKAGPSHGPGGEVTPASIVTATGQMTEAQAVATRQNLGAGSVNPPDVVDIISATPTIEPKDNEIYKCGELTSLTISNPPAVGKYAIIFSSGSTATTTIGIENFIAEANKRYKITVEDNYATYDSWPYTP